MDRSPPNPAPRGPWQRELREGATALGVPLGARALALFGRYLWELGRWQARGNLTGFRTSQAIVVGGFLDSISCLKALPQRPMRIVDIGSGAGFPGLPLRIVRPDLALTLVEANRRRHSFLAHLCRHLGLLDVRCLHGRAEILARGPGLGSTFDAAFARAVRQLPMAASLAREFLCAGGIFIGQQPAAAAQKPPHVEGYSTCSVILVPRRNGPAQALLVYGRAL